MTQIWYPFCNTEYHANLHDPTGVAAAQRPDGHRLSVSGRMRTRSDTADTTVPAVPALQIQDHPAAGGIPLFNRHCSSQGSNAFVCVWHQWQCDYGDDGKFRWTKRRRTGSRRKFLVCCRLFSLYSQWQFLKNKYDYDLRLHTFAGMLALQLPVHVVSFISVFSPPTIQCKGQLLH